MLFDSLDFHQINAMVKRILQCTIVKKIWIQKLNIKDLGLQQHAKYVLRYSIETDC